MAHLHLLEFMDRKALPAELRRLRKASGGDLGLGQFSSTEQVKRELNTFFLENPRGLILRFTWWQARLQHRFGINCVAFLWDKREAMATLPKHWDGPSQFEPWRGRMEQIKFQSPSLATALSAQMDHSPTMETGSGVSKILLQSNARLHSPRARQNALGGKAPQRTFLFASLFTFVICSLLYPHQLRHKGAFQ